MKLFKNHFKIPFISEENQITKKDQKIALIK